MTVQRSSFLPLRTDLRSVGDTCLGYPTYFSCCCAFCDRILLHTTTFMTSSELTYLRDGLRTSWRTYGLFSDRCW
ncbi:MAG: hypothetical protein LDL41_00570 [Coleofasciculus sp. S288]|nr:hypothetical protein [Coleofasciculus sp. S288]